MFRVIVAGGRDFDNYDLLCERLDHLLAGKVSEGIIIVCGMARGADMLGHRYAQERGHDINEYPAEWSVHGRAAGYIRNQYMADRADALVAFWDGSSKGTKHMIDIARAKGLQVKVVSYTTNSGV